RLSAGVMPRDQWAALGLGALGLAGVRLRRGEAAGGWIDRLPLVLVLVMLALTAVSLFVLLPQIEGLREAMLGARAGRVTRTPPAARGAGGGHAGGADRGRHRLPRGGPLRTASRPVEPERPRGARGRRD